MGYYHFATGMIPPSLMNNDILHRHQLSFQGKSKGSHCFCGLVIINQGGSVELVFPIIHFRESVVSMHIYIHTYKHTCILTLHCITLYYTTLHYIPYITFITYIHTSCIYLSIHPSIYLPTYLSIHPSTYLHTYVCIYT